MLLEAGREGRVWLLASHDVEGDVPLENMLAVIDTARAQLGAPPLGGRAVG